MHTDSDWRWFLFRYETCRTAYDEYLSDQGYGANPGQGTP